MKKILILGLSLIALASFPAFSNELKELKNVTNCVVRMDLGKIKISCDGKESFDYWSFGDRKKLNDFYSRVIRLMVRDNGFKFVNCFLSFFLIVFIV